MKEKIGVTDHAVQRFYERTGAKYELKLVVNKILHIYCNSKEVFLDLTKTTNVKKYKKNVRYFDYNGIILVVYKDEKYNRTKILTMFNNTRKEYV